MNSRTGLNTWRQGDPFTRLAWKLSHLLHKSRTASFTVRTGLDLKTFENEAQGINTTKDNLMNVSLGFGGNRSDSYLGRTFYDLKFEMGLREGDSSRGLAFQGQAGMERSLPPSSGYHSPPVREDPKQLLYPEVSRTSSITPARFHLI